MPRKMFVSSHKEITVFVSKRNRLIDPPGLFYLFYVFVYLFKVPVGYISQAPPSQHAADVTRCRGLRRQFRRRRQ